MRRSFIACAALAAAFVPISPCSAEMPEREGATEVRTLSAAETATEPAPATAEVHLNLVDQKLALSLAVDTHMQIEMAKVALESIQDGGIRRLLNERIQSQEAFAAELEKLTAGRASEAIADARAAIQQDKEGKKPAKFQLLSLQKNATAMLVRVRMEILDQYCQMVCAELDAKKADTYDRNYLQADLLHQMQMLATLDVFAGQASNDFAGVIGQASSAARKQLADARQLWLQMETTPLVETAGDKVPLVAETASER